MNIKKLIASIALFLLAGIAAAQSACVTGALDRPADRDVDLARPHDKHERHCGDAAAHVQHLPGHLGDDAGQVLSGITTLRRHRGR